MESGESGVPGTVPSFVLPSAARKYAGTVPSFVLPLAARKTRSSFSAPGMPTCLKYCTTVPHGRVQAGPYMACLSERYQILSSVDINLEQRVVPTIAVVNNKRGTC